MKLGDVDQKFELEPIEVASAEYLAHAAQVT